MIADLILSLSLVFAYAQPSPAATAPSWSRLAERMTGESDRVRERCLSDLRAMPDLEARLRDVLHDRQLQSKTQMFLALDAVSNLKLQGLLPDLMDLSRSEPSGYLYHTINTLVTPQNRQSIISLYQSRVLDPQTSPAAQMALIDTLARFGSALSSAQLHQLLLSPAIDVRKTALSFARTFLIRRRHLEYLPLVQEQLHSDSFFLRAQASYLLRELRERERRQKGARS